MTQNKSDEEVYFDAPKSSHYVSFENTENENDFEDK